MLRILLLSVLATLALAEPRYLKDIAIEERVVGGEIAKPHSWPWQISLQYSDLGTYYYYCSGTLIRPGWVMVAAHCVEALRKWTVALGDHDIYTHEGPEQYISVSEVFIHPNWNPNNVAFGYDIALLRLSIDATLSSYVQVATLPSSGEILPYGHTCYITGWGYTETGGSLSAQLKQAYMPVVDYETCSQKDWWGSSVKETMICAGGTTSMSACHGDSGSPLNCLFNGKYVVHGVTSFVSPEGCNTYKKPTGFTRVSAYINWINQIISEK
ncbi:chymotrypsin-like elastase family member 1.2 precursor [Danio rerio]|uniref:pancreatic elastase n=1 Tax=Danio rerio TaxID=7955 RepID=A0A8M1P7N7_DANRE|nr:chymotrypsin-like elastase family member 1.2 precursor [Danio rerio]|eukprot:NP_001307331.1 si:dkey-57c15.4 precursor [Danio rerio]